MRKLLEASSSRRRSDDFRIITREAWRENACFIFLAASLPSLPESALCSLACLRWRRRLRSTWGGDVGRCGEMWGDVGRCGEKKGVRRREREGEI